MPIDPPNTPEEREASLRMVRPEVKWTQTLKEGFAAAYVEFPDLFATIGDALTSRFKIANPILVDSIRLRYEL